MSKLIEGVPTRDHALRSFVAPCPRCHGWTEVLIGTPAVDPPREAACRQCGHVRAVDFATHYRPEALLDGCPACGYHTLYIQKDVNSRLGVTRAGDVQLQESHHDVPFATSLVGPLHAF